MTVHKADILAQQLETLCRTTLGMAGQLEPTMKNEDLLDRVVMAYYAGILAIRKHSEIALALARRLSAVHSSLNLVAGEHGKGPARMAAIVDNAPAMVQEGLLRGLALYGEATDPAAIYARSLLTSIGKATAPLPLPVTPPPPDVVPGCPTVGAVFGRYIELRRAMGSSKGEVDTLLLSQDVHRRGRGSPG